MRIVKLADILDRNRNLITATDGDANDKNKKLYTSSVADHKEVVMYAEHGVLVLITWKTPI